MALDEVLLTKTAPDLAIGVLNAEDLSKVLNCIWELILRSQDTGNGKHSLYRLRIEEQGAFIGLRGALELAHQF